MTEVVIRNKELLETLNSFSDEMLSKPSYNDEKYWTYHEPEDVHKGDYYTSREYLEDCLSRGRDGLVGPPDRYFAQPISKMVREDKEMWGGFMQKVKYDFAYHLGAHTSALLSYYPPGGFVGWHTNYDANAYQVLFTWSETGEGFFEYYDKKTDEIVKIQDVPGWQCRHYYFGAGHEEDLHCWHAAYAGCQRITLAYKFVNNGSVDNPEDAKAQQMRDMLIEEIENEE
jgi:hypothetical protein